jgi:hypothetical protein
MVVKPMPAAPARRRTMSPQSTRVRHEEPSHDHCCMPTPDTHRTVDDGQEKQPVGNPPVPRAGPTPDPRLVPSTGALSASASIFRSSATGHPWLAPQTRVVDWRLEDPATASSVDARGPPYQCHEFIEALACRVPLQVDVDHGAALGFRPAQGARARHRRRTEQRGSCTSSQLQNGVVPAPPSCRTKERP